MLLKVVRDGADQCFMVLQPDKVHFRLVKRLAPGEMVQAVAELHGIKVETGEGVNYTARTVGRVAGGVPGALLAEQVTKRVGKSVLQTQLKNSQGGAALAIPVKPCVIAVTTHRVLFVTLSAMRATIEAEFMPLQLASIRPENGVQSRMALMFTFLDGSATGRAVVNRQAGTRVAEVFGRLRRGGQGAPDPEEPAQTY